MAKNGGFYVMSNKVLKAVYFGREEIQSFILSLFYFSYAAHLTNYMRTPYRSAYFYP